MSERRSASESIELSSASKLYFISLWHKGDVDARSLESDI